MKLDGLFNAIADGLRSPGLLAKIEVLEAEKAQLEAILSEPAPDPVRLHPNLSDLYRAKVARLRDAIADPAIRDEAIGILRGLIKNVVAGHAPDGWAIEVHGEIAALVALGLAKEKAPRPGLQDLQAGALCSAKVVGGARNTRYRPELRCRL
jgi:site-specific DNA recombinase